MNYTEDQTSFEEAQRIARNLINKYLHEEIRDPRAEGRYDNTDKWLSDFRTYIVNLKRKDFF